MKPFSLLVKPASADCNLRCEYCFYLDRCELYPDAKVHRMSDEVLEAMIGKYMATPQQQYAFGWQGGEPTLMGVDFFKRAVELQQKYGKAGTMVANGLQTNTTLIDDEFAAHLGEFNYLVGVSVDGPPEIHNRYRRTAGGKPTHAAVMEGVAALRRHNVEFNILVLVSQSNVREAKLVYNYLCDQGFMFHQYIPCVEFDESGRLLPFAISGPEWGDFLCGIYDQWCPRDTRRVSVRHFDSILTKMVDGTYNVCCMGRDCRQYFVVEHNGDVYPCDFFVREHLKLGNILEDSWEDLQQSQKYRRFGLMKSQWNDECKDCFCLEYCSGDCLKYRIERPPDDPRTLSLLCEGWKQFYRHTLGGFEKLAGEVRRERQAAQRRAHMEARMGAQRRTAAPGPAPVPHRVGAVGRNDPCPCGSGKKYKNCCGRA